MTLTVLINPGLSMKGFIESCKVKKINLEIIQDYKYAKKYKKCYINTSATIIERINYTSIYKILKKLQTQHTTIIVVGCHDNILKIISEACLNLNIPFTSPKCIELCRNKYKSRQLLYSKGSVQFGNIDIKRSKCDLPLKYPIVCKPKMGWGSEWVEKIYTESEFIEYVKRTASLESPSDYSQWFYEEILDSGYFWEEWINGPVITVELFIDKNKRFIPMISIAHQFHETCFGSGTIIPYCPSKSILIAIENSISNLIEKMQIDYGVFDIEMKLINNSVHIIDINARPMGGEMIKAFDSVSKISFSTLFLDFFLSNKIPKVTYKGYSSTNKVMCNDTIVESKDSIMYLNEIGAITYVNNKSFPLRKNTILARYITKSSSPLECIKKGKNHISRLKSLIPIKIPDYKSTEDVITMSLRNDSFNIIGSMVYFSMHNSNNSK